MFFFFLLFLSQDCDDRNVCTQDSCSQTSGVPSSLSSFFVHTLTSLQDAWTSRSAAMTTTRVPRILATLWTDVITLESPAMIRTSALTMGIFAPFLAFFAFINHFPLFSWQCNLDATSSLDALINPFNALHATATRMFERAGEREDRS